MPSKPIQYVVNTHHHFDHSGGLRTFVAQGATVVTHEQNKDFYERVFFSSAPRTVQPDRLSTLSSGRPSLPRMRSTQRNAPSVMTT